MRFKLLLLAFITLSFLSYNVLSQEPLKYSDISHSYKTALELYENKMYGAAQKLFVQILLSEENFENSYYKKNAAFYIAMCGMYLTNNNAEYLITKFIKENPESPNKNTAILNKANHYFKNKRYRDAINWYERVDIFSLKQEQITNFYFNLGFSHFARKDYNKSTKYFYEVKDVQSLYGYMSLYFYSHIKYLNKEYQTALLGFYSLKDNPQFQEIIPFYLSQIYYFQEKYDELLEYVVPIFYELSSSEIAKIIGSSFFKTGNFEEAIPYLKNYYLSGAEIKDEDNYELGFAFYMQNNYEKAIKYFSQIESMNTALSQNAAYHMGGAYLNMNMKKEAKLAFETASRFDFNETIREDALFNYAQLSLELDINPFNEGINALTTYIEMYPNSYRIDLAYDYLVSALWTSKNYKDAITTIEKIENRTPQIDKAYQRLTYYRGLEYLTTLKNNEAIKYFEKSLEFGQYDPKIRALSLYWKADAFFRLQKYEQAIKYFEQFINTRGALVLQEFDLAHYNIGYAYFNLRDYTSAGLWFRKYEMQTNEKETLMFNDALNRIGDSYYISRNFNAAADYYKKSIQLGILEKDYPLYQMALAYGGSKKPQQKVWALSRLLREYPKSEYAANSCYEVGRTYNTELNNPDSAKFYFNLLLTQYPNSAMKKQALASLGGIYYNERNFEKSLDNYKKIIALYPNTNQALNAVEMIKTIYIEMNKTEEYFEFASKELEGFEITPDQQDSIAFLAAKNLYIDQKFEKALIAITNYLEKYPESRNAIEAHYYKAELHYHFNQNKEALKSYLYIADRPRGIYSEHSALRASGLLYNKNEYSKALYYYQKLYSIAENKNNKHIATIGILRTAYFIEDYDNVIDAAVKIIENNRSSQEQIREAYHKMAKAHYAKNRKIRALSLFERLAKETTSYEGAESKYRTAEINYKMGNDSIAEEIVYEFAKMNSPQQYWIAKSFILLSDIFYDRKDYFSAKHTLQSVLNNYPNEIDGIKDLASDKLYHIIQEEQEIKLTNEFLELEIDINNDGIQELEEVKNNDDEAEIQIESEVDLENIIDDQEIDDNNIFEFDSNNNENEQEVIELNND